MTRRSLLWAAGAAGCLLAAPVLGVASDAQLMSAYRGAYLTAEQAAARASGPEGTQQGYDAARDLQEAVRAAAPVSAGCRPLLSALARYSAGRVFQYEGVDRPSAGDTGTGRRRAEAARAQITRAASGCRGTGGGARPRRLSISPSTGEAFYGAIVVQAPAGADRAELIVRGQSVVSAPVRGGKARLSVSGRPGRYDLHVRFSRQDRAAGGIQSKGAWYLGSAGLRAVPGSRSSASLANALTRATSGGPSYRAAWIQDLATGEAAGVNAAAAFPAASTVKLGLMVGAIERLGGRPEDTAYAYDLRAMAGWSSNLATNRILRRLGGGSTATAGLARLGARQSTFPGEYIVGTELQPSLPGASGAGAPPRVSQRVTSAQDLGRMLYAIQASAAGAPGARNQTGLTVHQARLLLGWLLSSQQRGDNLSLLAGGAPGMPIAQKNGWISDARLGAGLIFTPRGPVIAVLVTFDGGGVSLSEAQTLGSRIARLAVSS